MIKKLIEKFLGGKGKYKNFVAEINSLEPELEKLSGQELKEKSNYLKKIIQENEENLNDFNFICQSFALIREAAKRTLNQRHFDVQLIGGLVLHEGKIAEMLTGEGKTLAATLPAYLNALSGKGVHVITVNDYLARRDAIWMGQVYQALGLSVACITHDAAYLYDSNFTVENDKAPEIKNNENNLDKERDVLGGFKIVQEFLRPISRKEAYAADIIYGTNHEFGFDYLRDNLSLRLIDQSQRPLNYAIIDEVDSILIDEARTPLIIASPDAQSSEYYKIFARIVDDLKPEEDYLVEEKQKAVNITQEGINKVEKNLQLKNLYGPENFQLVHYLEVSLKAKALFRCDKHYLVKNGEVIIIDEFTGHLMHGRRYSVGLHQAIEAKEWLFDKSVNVQLESRTLAQITIQNYFRLYKKISGMTGTAQTSAEEFHKVYNLEVVSIPSNKPLTRKDFPDAIYKTREAKYQAAIEEIKKYHDQGRPILVGTPSTDQNEILSGLLFQSGIPHEVLNAKNNEREGAIIAQAGKLKAVTVATNRAGRGVDIVLGGNPVNPEEAEKVRNLGGLCIIGTERHEARRIDNQLRGRAGRQGDPGASRFFLSLEDDLLKIFGGDKIKNIMQAFKLPEDMPIESGLVSNAVNQAQAKIEGFNFDIRRHLLDFDDILNKQRSFIYGRRQKILNAIEKGDFESLFKETTNKDLSDEEKTKLNPELKTFLGQQMLRIMDLLWMENLENLESLRESVSLRAYGQHEPIVEYRQESYRLFKSFQANFQGMVAEITSQILANPAAVAMSAPTPPPDDTHKKIGRNDPCWCGAKKPDGTPIKYKHCHGK
ncbi:MAG: preprotein translocase subunit SecA [bacterium]|nr:preprotein translocase subunit SecA [bacterium]